MITPVQLRSSPKLEEGQCYDALVLRLEPLRRMLNYFLVILRMAVGDVKAQLLFSFVGFKKMMVFPNTNVFSSFQ